jgi:hypothetical protein
LEYELFCALRRWVADQGDRLRRVADLLANIDVLVSWLGWLPGQVGNGLVTEAFGLQITEGGILRRDPWGSHYLTWTHAGFSTPRHRSEYGR